MHYIEPSPNVAALSSDPVWKDFWGAIGASALLNKAKFARTPEKKHAKLLKKIISQADIVFGLFEDPDHPNSYDISLIKGSRMLAEVVRSGNKGAFNVQGIHCRELAEALAMNHVFGDKLSI